MRGGAGEVGGSGSWGGHDRLEECRVRAACKQGQRGQQLVSPSAPFRHISMVFKIAGSLYFCVHAFPKPDIPPSLPAPLLPPRNMIFEVADLAVASPATVSRCGMVYVQPDLLGWRPVMQSWLNTLPEGVNAQHKHLIVQLFDWLLPPCARVALKQVRANSRGGLEGREGCQAWERRGHKSTNCLQF